MESFLNENNVLNISVRYSPTASPQRGGKKAREKRRERREQERTSLENGEIKEERNEYGIQDNQSDDSDIRRIQDYCEQACLKLFPEKHHLDDGQSVSQDNQYDPLYKDQCDYIDIHRQMNKAGLKLFPEKHQSDAGPVTSFYKPVTSSHRDQDRRVKVKLDRDNYGHLFNLLKLDQEQMKKDQEQMKKDQEQMKKDQEQMKKNQEHLSRSNQNERMKSKQNRQTNKVFCNYCQRYCPALHYCETKKMYIHQDYFLLIIFEGANEEELSWTKKYRNKVAMRDDQISDAKKWFKERHDEEQVLSEERQHMLLKTKPKPLDEQPIITEDPKGELVLKWKLSPELGPHLQNNYLVEYAKHSRETDDNRGHIIQKIILERETCWKDLAVIEKGPLDKIKLTTFPWDPKVEYKFRVSVINHHGMSPASICAMTTDMSEENRAIWKKIRQSPENMERRIQQREHEQRIQSNILRHKL